MKSEKIGYGCGLLCSDGYFASLILNMNAFQLQIGILYENKIRGSKRK